MLARRDGLERDLGVRGGDGEVEDELDLGVGDELVDGEGAQAPLLGDGLRAGLVEIGDGDRAHRVEPFERGQVGAGDRSEADDADPQRLAHRMPLSMMVRTFGSASTPMSWPGVATKIRPWPHRRVHTAGQVTGRCHGW